MHTIFLTVAILLPCYLCQQQSTNFNTSSSRSAGSCGLLSSAISFQLAINGSAPLSVQPSLVLDCYRSVPINTTLGVGTIAWLKNYIQLQTTLAYLKNPPPEYQRPAVDILARLDDIAQLAANGSYDNEFDFETDIAAKIYAAADMHFDRVGFFPDSLSNDAVSRDALLASVSVDGRQVPDLYFVSDIQSLVSSNASFTPSPVIAIDGQDASDYLERVGRYNPSFQDPDAGYNALLYNVIPIVTDTTGIFNTGFDPSLGDNTTYTFKNGSRVTINNTVSPSTLPIGFQNGQDLFLAVSGNSPVESSTSASTEQTASPTITSTSTDTSPTTLQPISPGFPIPVIAQSNGAISGYFLPQKDVAVLVINNFDFFDSSYDPEFQMIAQKFLGLCKSSGKTSLIIDVRRNLGGYPGIVFDLYRQLFPGHVPFTKINLCATNTTNTMGQLISQFQNLPRSDNATIKSAIDEANTTIFNYHIDLQYPDGPSYESWSDLFGPVTSHGDNFSNTASFLLGDTTNPGLTDGIVISGYGNMSNVPPSPFSASQITVLTDGMCSSACAYFVRLLVDEGVKTVVAGGKPSTKPMALIGGTQGGQTRPFSDFQVLAQTAAQFASVTYSNISTEPLLPLLTSPPYQPDYFGNCGVNLFNNIGRDDPELTPLQFTFTPAQCRMFYMPRDILDPEYTWLRVAEGVENGGKGLCIEGGGGLRRRK